MLKNKFFWIGVVVVALALLGGGAYMAWAKGYVPWLKTATPTASSTTLQTATVTQGNLSITADGTGVLVASDEVSLAFESSGTVTELLVKVGDQVQAGDVLAHIDDTEARNAVIAAELSVLSARKALKDAGDTASLDQAVSQAELQVAQAQAKLATAQSNLDDLLNWTPDETEIEIAKANLAIAQASYQNTVSKANMRDQELASTRIKLQDAIRNLSEAQANYANAMDSARDWERNIESTRENAAKSLKTAQDNLEIAQASYDLAMIDTRSIDIGNARIKVLNAQTTLDDLQTPPDKQEIAAARLTVHELEVALAQAQLNLKQAQESRAAVDTTTAQLNLEQAELKLELASKTLQGTILTAPIDGVVTTVNLRVGEKAGGTAIVISNLNIPLVKFWVEESDLNSVAVGHPVHLVFEALPDLTYNGQIIAVDPVLTSVGNTTAVQAWASIDASAYPVKLLGQMNVEVEIVAGEARNALLVPVQALRKLGENQYAVFVVLANGELEMRMVEIGLQDYVNAQVISGLQRGDVVTVSSKTTSTSTQTKTNQNSNMGGFPDGGMMIPIGPGG